VITGIDRIVNSKEMQQTVVNLEKTTRDIDILVRHVDNQVMPLSSDVRSTLDAAKVTLGEANKALASAKAALDQAEKALTFREGSPARSPRSSWRPSIPPAARSTRAESPRGGAGPDLPERYIGYEVGSTLEETKSLSRSIRSLSITWSGTRNR